MDLPAHGITEPLDAILCAGNVMTFLAASTRVEVLRRFAADEELALRLQIVEPLFGLKWCTILLNEFVAADLARRRFAAGRRHGERAVSFWPRPQRPPRQQLSSLTFSGHRSTNSAEGACPSSG